MFGVTLEFLGSHGTSTARPWKKKMLETTNVNDTKSVPKVPGNELYEVVCKYSGKRISLIEIIFD